MYNPRRLEGLPFPLGGNVPTPRPIDKKAEREWLDQFSAFDRLSPDLTDTQRSERKRELWDLKIEIDALTKKKQTLSGPEYIETNKKLVQKMDRRRMVEKLLGIKDDGTIAL